MIPEPILDYLNREHVTFTRRWHPRAVGGQEVAASLHITGRRVSKCVVVSADAERMVTVLPVAANLDEKMLAEGLSCARVRILSEEDLAGLFPDCELGAEPPFGRLYGLPVVVDALYAQGDTILFRAGSHEETLELPMPDYLMLERPRLVTCARPLITRPRARAEVYA